MYTLWTDEKSVWAAPRRAMCWFGIRRFSTQQAYEMNHMSFVSLFHTIFDDTSFHNWNCLAIPRKTMVTEIKNAHILFSPMKKYNLFLWQKHVSISMAFQKKNAKAFTLYWLMTFLKIHFSKASTSVCMIRHDNLTKILVEFTWT